MERKHAQEIKKWASNSEAVVYHYDRVVQKWIVAKTPGWSSANSYKVIFPEYQEAWEAYLDGEMEFREDDYSDFRLWNHKIPSFNACPSQYRRRPKQDIQVTVTLNGKEISPSKISKDTWEALRSS